MEISTVKTIDLKNKKVLMRVDFNVPIDSNVITDTTRIDETIPTIDFLIKNNCSIVLMSHLGSPKGKKDANLSLRSAYDYLKKKIKTNVYFSEDCIGHEAKNLSDQLKPKEILLLENLRFHSEEETPSLSDSFAQELSALGEFYINEAFGSSHREHSSIVGVCKYFKGKSCIGLLMEKEIKALDNLYKNPKRPFLAIFGGAKIESKIQVIKSLLPKLDALMIGGGMASSFLASLGNDIYSPLVTETTKKIAQEILILAKANKTLIYLPKDFIIADESSEFISYKSACIEEKITKPWTPVDLGPQTIKSFCEVIPEYETIFWNGPLGIYEKKPFDKGTESIAKAIGFHKCTSIVGGGDSIAAIKKLGLKENFSHLSTGGGASIEFLEKGTLLGLDAIKKTNSSD